MQMEKAKATVVAFDAQDVITTSVPLNAAYIQGGVTDYSSGIPLYARSSMGGGNFNLNAFGYLVIPADSVTNSANYYALTNPTIAGQTEKMTGYAVTITDVGPDMPTDGSPVFSDNDPNRLENQQAILDWLALNAVQ